ncbi:hypothetical protein ACFQZS_12340 [Mucilaginibacter calamicampi]|uniref:MG2 domain-containing protein n=1 Tax=Mucilaginibacter calamicampi TaxID=1302352 RepID=A0ABW2Z2K8_9SPHI
MKRLALSVLVWAVLSGCLAPNCSAQIIAGKIKNFSTALNNIRQLKPIEKLHLQTDKPYYSTGDTLRFKAYLLNADYLTPALQSGLLYVELDNAQGISTKRIMVPVANGLAWGDIALDSAEVPHGSYSLRAYTNWMRNFGDDYIFKKTLTIAKSANNPLLVKANFKQVGNKVEVELLFTALDGSIQAFKDVELKIMNGRKNLSKDKVMTSADGSVKANFTMPEGTGALSIQATTAGSGVLTIPVSINRKENTDLQFMPEGGQLVAGLTAKVGFKAIGEDGKGVAVKGNILDSKGNKVATFSSAYAGMGNFTFTPAAGETYLTKVDGIAKTYPLPSVKPGGTALSVTQTEGDSLQIQLLCTPNANASYTIVGQAKGVLCFAKTVNLNGASRFKVAKALFPSGITRFTLLQGYQPINERIVFINQHDGLKVSVKPHKLSYNLRDSVTLDITVKDNDGEPVEGNFSLAVTDNSQIKQDSLGSNILNRFLLTSDLKGDIEDPAYYFMPNKEVDLDNLMLTQGWIGYDWKEVFHTMLPYAFKPEKEFVVTGKVSTAFGKPIENSNVVLFANNPPAIKDTLTDNTGQFIFKGLFPVDTVAVFKLQARNKRGKEMNVKIDMDELHPPVFAPLPLIAPWYFNADSTLLNNTRTKIAEENALSAFKGEGNVLKMVNIKSKKVIKGSKNLNGPGEADFFIDEEELKKMPSKKSLGDMLSEKFPSFIAQGGFWHWRSMVGGEGSDPLSYVWNGKKVRFVFDGIDLDFFFTPMANVVDPRYHNIKPILDYFTAEDISGIEIMQQTKYTSEYHASLGLNKNNTMTADSYVFIEITTRAKQGPFMKVTPGTALYKAIPYTLAKQFYSPKYNVSNKGTALGTDLRSTIFWEPNVITDENGKATVSFYSADKAANYTVIVEGTDMDGGLGFGKQQITVK